MTATNGNGNPKWIGDGSEGGNLDVTTSTASSSITFASATQGTPFNIRLDTNGAPMGKLYYEVKVTNMSKGASLGVGLVTEDRFQPGWKTKGCFYNGNITNGSAGLIIGFGKCIKEGDAVGVYHQRWANQCNIIFFHNGQCLGAGFSLDDNNEILFPCLHLSGSATVAPRAANPSSKHPPRSTSWILGGRHLRRAQPSATAAAAVLL